ncbi:MAG TPA: hypothetical protein VJA40_02975 [archaeon]|nr:hypothetical protein [archaeon]
MAGKLKAMRGINEALYAKAKKEALEKGKRLSDVINQALEEHFTQRRKNILNAKTFKFGDNKVNWSMEVDKIVYGE